MKIVLAAHISNDGRIHAVVDHLKETANHARDFTAHFGASDEAYLCGILHDIGKYSEAFQNRIYKKAIR